MKTFFGIYILAVVNALGYVDPIHVSKSNCLNQRGETFTGRDGLNPYWQILENSSRIFSEISVFRLLSQIVLLEKSSKIKSF